MSDRRSLILARLFVILQGIDGLQLVVRNRKELSNDKRPAILLFDGSENREGDRSMPRGRLAAVPSITRMIPEIWLSLPQKKPHNEAVGEELNSFRLAILRAVLNDQTLQEIVGSNGEIRYEGCDTDLSRQGEMNGEMGIEFAFLYPIVPSEL